MGKTTLATNLAVALARQAPGQTVLIDLYSQFGDVPTMLNLNPRRTLADLVAATEEMDAQSVEEHLETHASGLRVGGRQRAAAAARSVHHPLPGAIDWAS